MDNTQNRTDKEAHESESGASVGHFGNACTVPYSTVAVQSAGSTPLRGSWVCVSQAHSVAGGARVARDPGPVTLMPRRSPTGAQHSQGEDSPFLAAGFPWAAGPRLHGHRLWWPVQASGQRGMEAGPGAVSTWGLDCVLRGPLRTKSMRNPLRSTIFPIPSDQKMS